LFQMLSSDAQVRAQLAGSADAMIRQSEQLSRIRDGAGLQPAREVARSVVPDVYRKALAVVLQPAPAASEQPKSKPRSASRSVVPALSGDSSQLSGRDSAVTNATQEPPATGEAGQSAAPTAQPAAAARPKQKIPKAETEKSAAAPTPRENNPASEAKARAAKALEAISGFASREDAVSWLQATLQGDPALDNLVAAYDQEVNAELVSDADKLIDHSASLRRGLARSEIHLLPEKWPGWNPTEHELPGLLVAIAFLSLGAPICYNLLKNIASLHPLQAMKRE